MDATNTAPNASPAPAEPTTRTVEIAMFPAGKVDAARGAVNVAHKKAVRAAKRTGQAAPAKPTIEVLKTYAATRCAACHTEFDVHTGGACIACRKGHLVTRMFVDLAVTYERPKLAGWEFLAVIEPMSIGGNLIKQVPGALVADGELARWREGAVDCDHCKTSRRRLETYIVRADGSDAAIDAGTYRQVGKNCLEAFLGGKSAAAIVAAMSIPRLISDEGGADEGGWGPSGTPAFDLAEFLTWTCAVVRHDGFVSKKAAFESGGSKTATAGFVDYLLTFQADANARARWEKARQIYQPSEADTARAALVLAWAKALSGATDYDRNMQLVAMQPYLDPKHAGILASAVPSYARAMGEHLERKVAGPRVSEHVGAVGDKKVKLGTCTLERVVVAHTEFGPLHIHAFRDAAGRAIVWKTSQTHGDAGDTFDVVGTIKRHSEFRDEKQTEMSRCKLEPVNAGEPFVPQEAKGSR